MTLKRLRRQWDVLGKTDPFWAVLTADDKRDNRWSIEEFFASGEREIDEVTAYVESLGVELDRGRALDFGCGPGRLTQALANRFAAVWGVDIAPSMIEQAERYDRHHGTCHYSVNERADLKMFESESFGFIYSVIVLQHIKPRYQRAYIREFVRILAPGGVLVFQLPSEAIPVGRPCGDDSSRSSSPSRQACCSARTGGSAGAKDRTRRCGGCRSETSSRSCRKRGQGSLTSERIHLRGRTGQDSVTPR